jgi:hypothetical protein
VQAVGVLARIDQFQRPLFGQATRQRKLDDVAMAFGVFVEIRQRLLDFGLGSRGRQVHAQGSDAHFGAVVVLAGHVRRRTGIVADQNRSESGGDAAGAQRVDPLPKLCLDRCRRGLAVQDARRHASMVPGVRPAHGGGRRGVPVDNRSRSKSL